jgi:mRNA interferase YafQ
MRTSRRTSRFKRDFKRIRAGQYGKELDQILIGALAFLLADEELPPRYRDHELIGEFADCRDCHPKPDLVLIYRKVGDDMLELMRLGSHSDLFD